MKNVVGLRCIRCDAAYSIDHCHSDCPKCRLEAPSGLRVDYRADMLSPRPREPRGSGLWRYGDLLPVDRDEAASLGEGGTPLLPLPRLGRTLGLERLFVKDETREPTGSFKDRLACIGVSAARAMGRRMIASSSSGNAGAAAAAYAARAGLPAIVFTLQHASAALTAQMRALGAMVAFAESPPDRLALVNAGVEKFGWFSTSPFALPVTGSNPLGLEGYKTIAYEIAESLNWSVPDWFVLPVCYGDALAAVLRGFEDMIALGWTTRVPRMVAAEVSGSLGAALASGDDRLPEIRRNAPTIATSIGAIQGTFQSLDALRRSGGCAVTVEDADMLRWQACLGREEGLWIEPSSAAALAATEQLASRGVIGRDAIVVVMATASGLKDPGSLDAVLPPVPVVPPDIDAALAILRKTYRFDGDKQ